MGTRLARGKCSTGGLLRTLLQISGLETMMIYTEGDRRCAETEWIVWQLVSKVGSQ